MAVRSRWQRLPTEAVNPMSRDIDLLPAERVVNVMLRDHEAVIPALRRARRPIARAAEIVAAGISSGGRLLLVGAGTSGRLGVLEAAELGPTFGVAPNVAVAVMAGGAGAVHRAREGVEDDHDQGVRSLRRLRPGSRDVVIGISASGVTPFVRGALDTARSRGAHLVGITCDTQSALKDLVDVLIVLPVGPEVIAGSTRLKAGTATKMALNMITTTAMVRVGKTYGNLMVDVKSNSDKLRDRARRIVTTVTGLPREQAEALLQRARWSVKAAILMEETGVNRLEAMSRLRVEPRLRKLLGGR